MTLRSRKPNSKARWYASPDITLRRGAIIALVAGVFLYGLCATQAYQFLETRIALPLAFQVRSWLGKDPELDPRLKIFVLDDETLLFLQDGKNEAPDELALSDWAKVLKSFQNAGPSAVFIDKVFGAPRGISDAPYFNSTVSSLPFPVITPAILLKKPIVNRPVLASPFTRLDSKSVKGEAWYAHGPDSRIASALTTVGHVEYHGDLRTQALLALHGGGALPAAGLLVDKTGTLPPLDPEGRFIVNFVDPKRYGGGRSFRLKNVVEAARKGAQISTIPKDGVVVVLTTLFSGGAGYVASPFGPIPPGHVSVAVLNSALSGRWIRLLPGGDIILILFALGGIAAAYYLWAARFWFALTSVVGFAVTTGLLLFSYESVHSNWLFWVIGFVTTALPLHAQKVRSAQSKSRRLKETLEGVVPPNRLAEILDEPESLALAPASRIVTVMFIDVVGFSLVAERQSAEQAFRDLKKLMQRLLATVHAHGGVVDKTMGDGMLCFFGYRHVQSEEVQDHANQAFQCALAIQRDNVDQNIRAADAGEPVYPLRIGINTSAAYIGDLGSSFRIELTLIGHGVNYAQRLESACDSNCIMLGVTTRDMLTNVDSNSVSLRKRTIRMKHHANLVEAFECDPFLSQPELRSKALRAYRDFLGIARKENRWPVPSHVNISIRTDHGEGNMVDFSESGFAVVLNQYHACGVTLSVEMESVDGKLREELKRLGLNSIYCEIRWSRPMDTNPQSNKYLHGLLIRNLTRDQRDVLLNRIRAALTEQISKTDAA